MKGEKEMKVAIVAATGKSGSMILKETLNRGLDVTAIVRRPERLKIEVPYIKRNIFELTKEDIEPFDVIISAFGNEDPKNRFQHVEVIHHFMKILENTQKRLITIGAAGLLYTDETRTKKLYDKLWMRVAGLRKGSLVLEQAYFALKESQGFHWTYMTPAVVYSYEGQRTGKYQSGGDVVLKNAKGKSVISYADFALALVDEIECPKHIDKIFSVAGI
jgi:Putative NADH-flavin reductase